MIEPSLTVGLVPRIANRLVATHNYPSAQLQNPLTVLQANRYSELVLAIAQLPLTSRFLAPKPLDFRETRTEFPKYFYVHKN